MGIPRLKSIGDLRADLERMTPSMAEPDRPTVSEVVDAMKRMCDILDEIVAMVCK